MCADGCNTEPLPFSVATTDSTMVIPGRAVKVCRRHDLCCDPAAVLRGALSNAGVFENAIMLFCPVVPVQSPCLPSGLRRAIFQCFLVTSLGRPGYQPH